MSEHEESGKTPGTDLREGIRTLPVLLVLGSGAASDASLQALLTGDLSDDSRLRQALDALRAHPAMDAARATLVDHVEQARAAARQLPEGAARAALIALTDYVLVRSG